MALLLEFSVIGTMTGFHILKDSTMSISLPVNEFPFKKFSAILLVVLLASTGCNNSGPTPLNPKAVVPVTGTIHIDGRPAEKVGIKLWPNAGRDTENPTASQGMTGSDGKFAMTTYYQGDGVPVGEYRLTFRQVLNTYVKPARDELQGGYEEPSGSTHLLSVTADVEAVDMGVINLSINQ
jgi:hypothetical protein